VRGGSKSEEEETGWKEVNLVHSTELYFSFSFGGWYDYLSLGIGQ